MTIAPEQTLDAPENAAAPRSIRPAATRRRITLAATALAATLLIGWSGVSAAALQQETADTAVQVTEQQVKTEREKTAAARAEAALKAQRAELADIEQRIADTRAKLEDGAGLR